MLTAGSFHGTSAARFRAAGVALLLAVGACGRGDAALARVDAREGSDTPPAGRIIDSILPVEEELRRFQEGLERPAHLVGGATSREALVRGFVDRLSQRDTAALRSMLLTRAEFAYLVYPTSMYTRPPYRSAPGLVWLQLAQGSAKGLTRLLREDVQVRGYAGHRCPEPPVLDGASTLWRQCGVRVTLGEGEAIEARLFGVIVEHDGRFKFASFANDF